MKKIKIPLQQNPYDVLIGAGTLKSFQKELVKRKLDRIIFTVVDSNVQKHHKNLLTETLYANSDKKKSFLFRSGEKNKNFDNLQAILKKMLAVKIGRDGLVVALGGGIVGDVTGFAASTFMRGIKYVQIPTTLLAAVDSSVGGKTGINFYETKNIVGSFYQPDLVVVDIDFFKTLTSEEILCGIGELTKYAFITDKKFYKYIDNNLNNLFELQPTVVEKVIAESVKYKGSVVVSDEKESGVRKVLNFGHTFAHAFEVEQNYKIKHGQAVILGISCALHLSNKMKLINDKQLEEYCELIHKFKDKIKIKTYDKRKLYNIMLRDKKNRDGKIKFVLIKNIGEILLDVEAVKEDVFYALDKGLYEFTR
ncbi:MAG: 3-dehydroquinate synthase [Ignavibacteriae bacterium HGW-Ignavibacteriae-2]|jgi:3-dehydroquinate synthase|nr:3-dehydroquinate synthase [Bacteroidota bacterium]PKL87454.1 MAG: 3-dehydroquinate synthase [Ignavibacteriae bacterium HGW-Ignavibacteriae-2]